CVCLLTGAEGELGVVRPPRREPQIFESVSGLAGGDASFEERSRLGPCAALQGVLRGARVRLTGNVVRGRRLGALGNWSRPGRHALTIILQALFDAMDSLVAQSLSPHRCSTLALLRLTLSQAPKSVRGEHNAPDARYAHREERPDEKEAAAGRSMHGVAGSPHVNEG